MKKSLTNIYVTHNAKDKTYDEFYNALGIDFHMPKTITRFTDYFEISKKIRVVPSPKTIHETIKCLKIN